jgi:hypothetical protein
MSDNAYPVRVNAELDPSLSRWLWLVKWVLVIPHYLVLVGLWAAFLVVSVIASFAILFTERYPPALFDFNLGVMRWSWRVHYYAYGAPGTDRYPPFTFAEVPEYPARLHVPYPERLSRRLVVVKWWLLSMPHYLILSILVGGGLWLGKHGNAGDAAYAGTGLLSLLVYIAAISLLFNDRYPESLYRLVVGLDRWSLRVTAYAALMTDEYPPFRLDQGGTDPGEAGAAPVPPSPTASPLLGPAPAPA